DPYCTQIWRGIQNHLRPMGLFPIVTDLQDDRSQFQPCLDMLLGRQVEGIIAIANPLYLDTRLLSEFAQRGVSAVVIGRELANVPVSSVVVDNAAGTRSEEHTSELQSRVDLVCRLLLEKKKNKEVKKQIYEDHAR